MAKKAPVSVKLNARIPTGAQAANTLGVDKNGDIQNYVTDLIRKNIVDFMPYRTGQLTMSTQKETSTTLKVDEPYAVYMYFGKTRTGKPINYNTLIHPNAGAFWVTRMIAERGAQIARQVRSYAVKKSAPKR